MVNELHGWQIILHMLKCFSTYCIMLYVISLTSLKIIQALVLQKIELSLGILKFELAFFFFYCNNLIHIHTAVQSSAYTTVHIFQYSAHSDNQGFG